MANCNDNFIDIVYSLGDDFCSQQTVVSGSPINTGFSNEPFQDGVQGEPFQDGVQGEPFRGGVQGNAFRCGCPGFGPSPNRRPNPSSVLSNTNTTPKGTQCGPGADTGCECENCNCRPIAVVQSANYRLCCNQSGTCGLYPAACRNTYWPNFCHPRWLSCNVLYCNQ